jgi:tight adherence protein B
VLLQRESGGNLSEIIDSLARLVRDRFKFRDKVKVLAAEGKISAIILVLLPFILILVIQLANPQYLDVLFQDPLGRKMALVASILMVIGVSVMYKMTKVKV